MWNFSYENDFDLHENEIACKTHFIWKVPHLDSFWNRGTRGLGSGLLMFVLLRLYKVLTWDRNHPFTESLTLMIIKSIRRDPCSAVQRYASESSYVEKVLGVFNRKMSMNYFWCRVSLSRKTCIKILTPTERKCQAAWIKGSSFLNETTMCTRSFYWSKG